VTENYEINANLPLSTCVVTCYVGGINCMLGILRALVASELVVHQELRQADMAETPVDFAESIQEARQQLGLS
jgi:hypothetical protein